MAKSSSKPKSGSQGGGNRSPQPQGQGKTNLRKFVRESWAELRKVQWPTGSQVAQGTLVVGVVTVFFAIFFIVVDFLAARLIQQIDKVLT